MGAQQGGRDDDCFCGGNGRIDDGSDLLAGVSLFDTGRVEFYSATHEVRQLFCTQLAQLPRFDRTLDLGPQLLDERRQFRGWLRR